MTFHTEYNYNASTQQVGDVLPRVFIFQNLILKQTGIIKDVELEIEKNQISIRPVLNPRVGWDFAFKTTAKNDDDVLMHGTEYISNSWYEKE